MYSAKSGIARTVLMYALPLGLLVRNVCMYVFVEISCLLLILYVHVYLSVDKYVHAMFIAT